MRHVAAVLAVTTGASCVPAAQEPEAPPPPPPPRAAKQPPSPTSVTIDPGEVVEDASIRGSAESVTLGQEGKQAQMQVRLVGGADDGKGGAFGEVLFDVSHRQQLKGSWANRALVKAQIRVPPDFAGDFARPARARLMLVDREGRHMYLPHETLARRPASADGWVTLHGRPTTDLPIPLGFTEPGFQAEDIRAIGINIEPGRRPGRVLQGTVEIRGIQVRFSPEPVEPRVLQSQDSIFASAEHRARAMEKRLRERVQQDHSLIVGINLPHPAVRVPSGETVQLYGTYLHAPEPWYGEHYDLGNPRVRRALRWDFRRIEELFGPSAVVRIFLFADLRAGVAFSEDGTPQRITERARKSVRTLLDIAEDEGVVLIPVLTDFLLADGKGRGGPDGSWRLGEHPELITDPGKRSALMELFHELVSEHAGHSAVLAWEVMNEPENARAVVTPRDFAALQRFLREGVQAIHRAGELATVGHRNPIDAALFMRGRVGADLGQAHYYPRLETSPAPYDLASDLDLAFGPRPAGWGEVPARSGHIASDLRSAAEAGQRFMLFWSWRGDDASGDGLQVRGRRAEIAQALVRMRLAAQEGR